MPHPKKVGTLPGAGSGKEKQIHEIKTAIPLLDAIEIRGKIISADALLAQRDLARYLVEERGAHYHFTVKGNQKHLLEEKPPFILNNLIKLSSSSPQMANMAVSKPERSG